MWDLDSDREKFQGNGFTRCVHKYSLYIKAHTTGDILLVCLYVGDLILTGNNPVLLEAFKKAMSLKFEMTDIGLMSYYLGLEMKQIEEGIFISQESYTKEIWKKFNMLGCNPVNTPMESGTKLSKFDIGEKIGLHSVHKSRRKSEVLDMYETKYSLCGWSSKSLHGSSYLHSLEGL